MKQIVLAFLAAFLLLASLALLRGERVPAKDELSYLEIAHALAERGTFTDGSFSKPGHEGEPGRFFAPAYPMLVHLVTRLDPGLATAVACHAGGPKASRQDCGGSFTALVLVHALLVAGGAACLFAISLMLTGSRAAAWLALALALAASEFRDFPRLMLSENLAFPSFLAFLAAGVAWTQRRGAGRLGAVGLAAAAGAALALAALTRPSYLYLVYAVTLVLALSRVWPAGSKRDWREAGAFVAMAGLVLAPWTLRNFALFGDPSLTQGYAAFTLAQRVAYNAMTWKEWAIAWLYWLPDFGDNLAKSLFEKSDWVRLGWTDPTSFYQTGAGQVFAQTRAAAGSEEAHLGHLLREHVLGSIGAHVAVTLPLTWRGIWAGGYLALAGALMAWPFMRRSIAKGQFAPLAALAVPLFFMAGLHGFVSVNIVRYNESMIALWATIVAWAIVELWQRRVASRRNH